MSAHTLRAEPKSARFRFQAGAWDRVAKTKGWGSYYAASIDLGVSHTTLSRAVTGQTYPGERLMAALMRHLPREVRFEDVFEVVVEEVR